MLLCNFVCDIKLLKTDVLYRMISTTDLYVGKTLVFNWLNNDYVCKQLFLACKQFDVFFIKILFEMWK